ncbi:MAG TPA: hypothetical protein VGB07_06710 [Blastocatellia bacterium]
MSQAQEPRYWPILSTQIARKAFLEAIERRVPEVIEQLETDVAPLLAQVGLEPLRSDGLWRLLHPLFNEKLRHLPADQVISELQKPSELSGLFKFGIDKLDSKAIRKFYELPETTILNLVGLRNGLSEWAKTYGLLTEWVLELVCLTLYFWARGEHKGMFVVSETRWGHLFDNLPPVEFNCGPWHPLEINWTSSKYRTKA